MGGGGVQDSRAAGDIDKFHMAGHVDAWCRQTCGLPANEALLEGVRTSVCEFTFTWLSNTSTKLST